MAIGADLADRKTNFGSARDASCRNMPPVSSDSLPIQHKPEIPGNRLITEDGLMRAGFGDTFDEPLFPAFLCVNGEHSGKGA